MSFNSPNNKDVINDNLWEKVKLFEVCELITRGITPSYTEGNGVVVINQKCIRGNRINLELSRLTNSEKKKISEQKYLKNYDVLVNSTGVGTLGRVAQIKNIKKNLTVDSHITIVRANNRIDPKFLGYNLFMQQPNIEHLAEGSTGQTELSRTRLGEAIKLLIPSLEEQKGIAHILSTLDEKIETNNQINKKLEEMAQAIYKQWFVDFEFLNEYGESYKSSGGEMAESELGVIPKGWSVIEIGDICEIQNGFAFKASEYSENGIKVMRTLNIGSGGYFENSGITYLPGSYSNEKYSKYLFKKFDSALVMVGASIGKIGIVLENTEKSLQNQNMWRFRTKEKSIPQLYLNYLVMEAQRISRNWATGSAREFYRKDSFSKIKVLISNREVLDEFNKIVEPIFEMISILVLENERINNIRDVLLPKLMSGEIRVPLD